MTHSSFDLVGAVNLMDRHRAVRVVALSTLMLAAVVVRIYNVDAPGILPEREFRSMTIARATYFQSADVAAWRREIAAVNRQKLGSLEPPMLELAVARIYQFAGAERVSAARIINALVWVSGGLFVYGIAVALMPPVGALAAAAYYLFVPLGVLVSRSFQPDSLMILLWLVSLRAVLQYSRRPTWPALLGAACASALTLLVKPLPVCTIFAAFIALNGRVGWKRLVDGKALSFAFIALVPAALYYGYGLFGSGALSAQAEMSFRPYLLQQREFWEGWLLTATSVVGPATLVAAFVAVAFTGAGLGRLLLAALLVGYALFGLLFTHHIHTHNYYHLQLVVITALSLGLFVSAILPALAPRFHLWYSGIPLALALLLIMSFTVRDIRTGLRAPRFEARETSWEIGEIVHHSHRVVHVSHHYGQPLEYYGELSGSEWPKSLEYWLYRRPDERALSVRERLSALAFEPEYFVVTDFDSFRSRHADLKRFLENRCRPLVVKQDFVIYSGSCVADAEE